MKLVISLSFLFVLLYIETYSQGKKKFYEHRKFWRHINEGLWLGAGGEYQQLKSNKNALLLAPDFQVRYGLAPRFNMSIGISSLVNFDGPIEYRNVGDVEFKKATYRYWGYRFEAGAGYYIKDFFMNKANYGLAVGANYSVMTVGGLNLDRLSPLITPGQSIVIRKYNGNTGVIKLYIALDRYLWLKNKQLALQLAYSYPMYEFKNDHIFSYQDQYYLYKSSGHSISLRVFYNLSPKIRYNPTKMQEL